MAGGGAEKANDAPNGESDIANAAPSAPRVEMASNGLGASRQDRPPVRMRNTTRVWVAMDSTNQPVRNTWALAWKTRIISAKVAKSNSDESGPITAANLTMS